MISDSANSSNLSSPTMHTMVITGLEIAINKALVLDPSTQKKLTTLENHCFHLHCTSPELDLYLVPGVDNVNLWGVFEGKADTTLTGGATDFINLVTSKDPAGTLINSGLELHGNTQALISLQQIARELDLDWEAPLASLFGDVIGHQMGKGIRHGMMFGKQLFKGLIRQVDDYVVEESDSMPARWEAEKFFNDVDQIAMRTERLAAKLNKLSQYTPLK